MPRKTGLYLFIHLLFYARQKERETRNDIRLNLKRKKET